jgi:hypothetical protein
MVHPATSRIFKLLIVLILWLCLDIMGFRACAADASRAAGNQEEVLRMIDGSIRVRKVEFRLAGQLFRVVQLGKEPEYVKGEVAFEAAFNPDSWYLRNISNSPARPAMTDGFMIGKSLAKYWGVAGDRKVVTEGEADKPNAASMMGAIWLRNLEAVRRLGVLFLEPGQVPDVPFDVRVNGREFSGKTERHGNLTGRLISDAKRIVSAEFQFASLPNLQFIARYAYSETGNGLPTRIEYAKNAGKGWIQLWYAEIDQLLIDSNSTNAVYTPDLLLQESEIKNSVLRVYGSNSVEIVQPDGSRTNIIPKAPDYSSVGSLGVDAKKRGMVKGLISAFSVGSVVVLITLLLLLQKKINKTKKGNFL